MMNGIAPLPAPAAVKKDGLFIDWMKKVDGWLIRLVGMDHRDLDDVAYWTWFDVGVGPKTAALNAIRLAKGDAGC